MSPTLSLLVALLPWLAIGDAVRLEWAPDQMFNPQTSPVDCGLKANTPGFVCDPNRLLGEHVELVNWVLADAAHNSTRCPCSTYYCETARKPKGYHIGVALVKKMTIQTNNDGRINSPEDQANLFAHKLESESGWGMGKCEEDIIIFYSADDQMLAIYSGSTALSKLTPYYQELLMYKASSRLEKGHVVEAMNVLIGDLKIILNCESKTHDCNLHEVRSSAGVLSTSLALLSMAVFSTLTNMF